MSLIPNSVAGLWNFYRTMAFVVGTTFAVLFFIALPYEYILDHGKTTLTIVAWTAHGWLFPIYLIATFLLSQKLRWSLPKTLLIMVAGTIPLMSFVAERKVGQELTALSD
ncbi:MAG: DUF3817 domain-containing protein [Actinomycetes bacterium]